MTTATLRRAGGSVILSLPKAILEAVGWGDKSKVKLTVQGNALSITPGYSIDELVAGITPDNLHSEQFAGERGAERVE
jgi:antitoxin component of MazEF toxin-antitoxin module